MFDDLLIHPRTILQLEQFINHPTHGLILVGPEGAGKKVLAEAVAAIVLGVQPDKLCLYPYYSIVNPEDNSIPIDSIRALEQVLKLKTPNNGDKEIRRVITIIDAGRMRNEAQNAFLKNLEEPPADTLIIMTAEANGDLLSTIYSRMISIEVLPIGEHQAVEYYSQKGVKASEIAKNYALSQGQAGLLDSLLMDESHPLKEAVELAKKLLSMPAGERLLQTEEISKDKVAVSLLLNALSRITHAALIQAGKSGNTSAIDRWKASLSLTQRAIQSFNQNANTKLLLDHLFWSL
jgi:hypothetical protein